MSISIDTEKNAIVAVQRVLARAAHAIDEGDAERLAGLFTAEGVLAGAGGRVLSGPDEIRDFFVERERLRDPSATRRRHHVSTTDAHLEADGSVHATSYFHVVGPGGQVAGVYHDQFERDGDEWLFRRRDIAVEVREAQ
jgi:uncharacterized protein (TIGR02246 family)